MSIMDMIEERENKVTSAAANSELSEVKLSADKQAQLDER